MRNAAASARSGVENVAMTASPIVFTTAPASAATTWCKYVKMLTHKIVGDEIADTLVERGRALKIGEQEGEACDLEPLIDIERVGAKDVAKCLVGEETLRRNERLALAEEMMKRVAGNPQRRQHAAVGAVFEREAQRARAASPPFRPAPSLC